MEKLLNFDLLHSKLIFLVVVPAVESSNLCAHLLCLSFTLLNVNLLFESH